MSFHELHAAGQVQVNRFPTREWPQKKFQRRLRVPPADSRQHLPRFEVEVDHKVDFRFSCARKEVTQLPGRGIRTVTNQSTQVTSSDGVSIHLFELKSGADELLMLHGVGRAGRTFSSYASLFPQRFRIRAIDFRGHGKSGRAGDRYRVVDYVHDAIAALEAIGKPTVIYGHSLGALVCTAVAAQRPDLVSAVVLEDPPSPGYWHQLESTHYYPTFHAMRKWAGRNEIPVAEVARGFGSEILKTFSDGRVLRISDVRDGVSVRFTARCVQDLDPAVMDAILGGRWPDHLELESCFNRIQCPVLIMRGDVTKGGMLPEPDAAQLVGLLKDGICIEFPMAGHLLHWQVRSEAVMQVSAFLESL